MTSERRPSTLNFSIKRSTLYTWTALIGLALLWQEHAQLMDFYDGAVEGYRAAEAVHGR